jgi:plastocyanin
MRSVRRALATSAALALAACGGGERTPRVHQVAIERFVYMPDSGAVAPGDTVVFTNRDPVPHTATAASGVWDSGEIPAGGTWRLVVATDGAGGYTCRYHPTMRGALTAE